MARVIAIGNNKGGIGKTTTAANLATGLVRRGRRVLAIDNDPQGHLSKCLGVDKPASLLYTLNNVMYNLVHDIDVEPADGLIKTAEGVDLMPTNLRYSGMELNLFSAMNREQILKEYVTMMRPFYDYIIIDCQPTLGLLTVNAFTSADSIIIPVTPEALPVDGLQQLFQTIGMIKKKLNPSLEIEGSTMLRAEAQTNLIDGLQSAAIGVAVLILQFIPLESTLGFLHYTGDFFVVTVLCIWSIKEPFVILFSAFRELTGGVTKEKAVCDAVVNATELGEDCFTVYKIGMKIKVCIPVNEKTESHIREKEKMLGTLRQNYESAEIEFVIR